MTLPLVAGTYRLDQNHTQIGFTVLHLGLTPVRGLFPEFEGVVRVGDSLADTALHVSITVLSVQSGHAGRDQRLQVPDYFDSATHPVMTFASSSIEATDDGWIIDGELTLKDVARPVRLAARLTGRKVYAMDGREHIGFVADGRLSRRAFGVAADVPDDILSDEIELAIAAQLIAD